MGSGNILVEGVNTFIGVFTRLREITKELIPYFIYIAIGALGISLIWNAVKYIMGYLNRKSKGTFRDYRRGPEREDSWSGMRKYYKEYQDHGYKLDERIKKKYNL